MFNLVATSCSDPENSARGGGEGEGGPDNVFFVFQRELYGPPSRSNWTREVQLFLEDVRTSISKGTYSHLWFSR